MTDPAKAVEILVEKLAYPASRRGSRAPFGPPRQEELFDRRAGEFTDPVYLGS